VGRLICRDFWASQKVLFEQKVSREKVKKWKVKKNKIWFILRLKSFKSYAPTNIELTWSSILDGCGMVVNWVNCVLLAMRAELGDGTSIIKLTTLPTLLFIWHV
jgi:hypothetical protein